MPAVTKMPGSGPIICQTAPCSVLSFTWRHAALRGGRRRPCPAAGAMPRRRSSSMLPMRRPHQTRLAGGASVGHRTVPRAACTFA